MMEQQLYKLPEGWEWSTISDQTEITKNIKPTSMPEQLFTYIDISSIDRSINEIVDPKIIIGSQSPSRAKKEVLKNDVLFATTRPNLKNIAIFNGNIESPVASTGFCVLRTTSCMDPKFLFYFLTTEFLQNQIAPFIAGAQYPAITDKNLKNTRIPLPPLNEQKRIVAKLDALFTRIDTAISHLQETLKLSKALFASALDETFVPTGDIERPPKAWTCELLATVSNLVTDGTHHSPKKQYDSGQEGLFKYVTSKNIKFSGMKMDGITYIPKVVHDEIYARCNPEYLDQLITKDGAMTGTCCLNTLDEPYSLLSSVALVKLKRKLMLPHFLNYFLQSPTGQELMIGDISGAAITRTNLKKLKAVKVPLPPMEEQERIVVHLEALSERTRTLEAATQEKLDDLTALKASLLDAAFRGQL